MTFINTHCNFTFLKTPFYTIPIRMLTVLFIIKIYKFIKYGIFVDAGNIWLSHDDADMPNAEFKFNRFYKEIGFGTGVGLRLDFGFFIIRLDAALPIYDPSQPPARRWIGTETVNGKTSLNTSINFTFGIGHAF